MSGNCLCPIWGTPTKPDVFFRGDGLNVDSPRAGGRYFISRRASKAVGKLDDCAKSRLTTWMIEQRRSGVERPELRLSLEPKGDGFVSNIESITQRPSMVIHARADELLKYVSQKTTDIGQKYEFWIGSAYDDEMETLAYTESVNYWELEYLLDYLEKREWVEEGEIGEVEPPNSHSKYTRLTVEGHAHLAELNTVVVASSKAFVAMWFDDSLDFLYPEGIEPAIKDAGYNASIINKEHFLDKIDDQIIAEIKRSRFVVADFTHGRGGARGSVYYEAGFAQGLGKDVIFTCRKDIIDNNKIHFDIRQYPYVVWEKNKLERFRESLAFRIARVIGDGPLKPVSG